MLTKKITAAIEEFDGAPELCWRYLPLSLEHRTAPSGYALYCITDHRENGTTVERRLWCGEYERAREISTELERRGLCDVATGLDQVRHMVIAQADARRC